MTLGETIAGVRGRIAAYRDEHREYPIELNINKVEAAAYVKTYGWPDYEFDGLRCFDGIYGVWLRIRQDG